VTHSSTGAATLAITGILLVGCSEGGDPARFDTDSDSVTSPTIGISDEGDTLVV